MRVSYGTEFDNNLLKTIFIQCPQVFSEQIHLDPLVGSFLA